MCVCGRPSVSLNNAKRKVQNRSVEFKKKEKKNFLNLCVVGDFLKRKTVNKGTRYYVDTFPRLMDPDHQNVGLCVCESEVM